MCPLRGLTSKKGITSCHAPESPLPQLLDTPFINTVRRIFGAVPLSRETGFSPQKEEHDTKVVLPESRYDLSVLPPSLEFVAAICVLALAEEGLCAKLDAGERN